MKVYNTLTRKKEKFVPIHDNKVSIYTCGPTVYDYIHVGNARPMVVFDTLRRFLRYIGYEVDYVVNFTDIDDKVINRANEENTTYDQIAKRYIEAFMEDAHGLNLDEANTRHPKATEYITEMIDFISGLIDKGAAYNIDGNVYFDISKAKDYGKLSKKNIEELVSGARIEVNDEKKNPMDFALWKKAKEFEPYWESPWGKGRPGWHIECSAMSKALLGDTIDIHAGGEDLQFPHHENEIAQSETLTGTSFANYWMHNGMLTIDNKKMSKSDNNFFTVKEISEEFDLEVLRFFLLSAHYRTPINFSRDIMDQMKNALDRLYTGRDKLISLSSKTVERELTEEDKEALVNLSKLEEDFIENMKDDLNTADGISQLFNLVRYSNQNFNETTNRLVVNKYLSKLENLADVLGFFYREEEILDSEIQDLIDKRQKARENKDFKEADEIRDLLVEKGIILEDTQEGVKWKRK